MQIANVPTEYIRGYIPDPLQRGSSRGGGREQEPVDGLGMIQTSIREGTAMTTDRQIPDLALVQPEPRNLLDATGDPQCAQS